MRSSVPAATPRDPGPLALGRGECQCTARTPCSYHDGVIHDALVVAVGYVLGTLPFAQVVAGRLGHDPTLEGSGNPGASNVFRTAGRGAGVAVFALDALKGMAAVAVGWVFGGRDLALVAGVAAVVGHVFPVTRGFRG